MSKKKRKKAWDQK